jgi:hypothetical protein
VLFRSKKSEIESVVSLIETDESEYRDIFMKSPTLENIQNKRNEYNQIIQKYLKLNSKIADKINTFSDNNFKNKNIIGIHLRGTDHPDKRPIATYFNNIDRITEGYDKIFIATDEQERYNAMRQRYGDKIISYNSIKSETSNALHHNPMLTDKERRKAGEDVIIEAYLLSKCNFLGICTNSNVNYLARAINPTLQHVLL